MSLRYTTCLLALGLSGCGGGGDEPPGSSISPAPSGPPTLTQRTDAATNTAKNNAACTTIQPFYWVIGDQSVALASDSVSGNFTPVTVITPMLIASASKWIYGAYVAELRNGQLLNEDITALTMRSGYTHFKYGSCIKLNSTLQDAETVNECLTAAHAPPDGFTNDSLDSANVGKFFYNGGHFQWHAVAGTSSNLGNLNNAQLQTLVANLLGLSLVFTYDSPQLAAGVKTTTNEYAFFLREILHGQLAIGALLGSNKVCTSPNVADPTCPTDPNATPITLNEKWHYSIGHWVEDDPTVGDGAFGFYPWIDSTKTYYGILAREDFTSATGDSVAADSVDCGRLIRKAWLTGKEQ